jgi:uncharacterized coiled-coil protein SlyX
MNWMETYKSLTSEQDQMTMLTSKIKEFKGTDYWEIVKGVIHYLNDEALHHIRSPETSESMRQLHIGAMNFGDAILTTLEDIIEEHKVRIAVTQEESNILASRLANMDLNSSNPYLASEDETPSRTANQDGFEWQP